jgi:hypothetical protein
LALTPDLTAVFKGRFAGNFAGNFAGDPAALTVLDGALLAETEGLTALVLRLARVLVEVTINDSKKNLVNSLYSLHR